MNSIYEKVDYQFQRLLSILLFKDHLNTKIFNFDLVFPKYKTVLIL